MTTFEFYSEVYQGEIVEADFLKILPKANEYINELCYYRTTETTLSEFQTKRKDFAICCAVDLFHALKNEASKMNIKSYSLGDLSVTYETETGAKLKNEYSEMILKSLEAGGFLYRGLKC